ncbi:hypothetical protein M758_4G109100 [Ceratodon purpureus]|nr:hypothetical protein M758_4G109100 [Ceratodon purpureus]
MARGRKGDRPLELHKRKKTASQAHDDNPVTQERRPNPFLRSWAWKREHRPDKDRFKNPYHHDITVGGVARTLVLHQAPFSTAGFASTVWDSAIVLAKYLEKWPETVVGKQCIELGAGCGLAGIAAAALGAKKTILTDFPENLPLLDRNAAANSLTDVVSTAPLTWGSELALEVLKFDVVLATDIMYYDDAVEPLLVTLQGLSGKNTKIFMAYGRNRQAEATFMRAVEKCTLSMRKLPDSELDDVYQCVDVDVYELSTRGNENENENGILT